jgi:hypothetical protein
MRVAIRHIRQVPKTETKYVILVRHASREIRWAESENAHAMKNRTRWTTPATKAGSDFETKGYPRAHALAGRLCDELENRKTTVEGLLCSKHKVTKETADTYKKVFEQRKLSVGEVEVKPRGVLTPRPSSLAHQDARQSKQTERIVCELKRWADRSRGNRKACVLVGHQPQLTQIARGLLNNKSRPGNSLPGNSLPIGNSEVACIDLGARPRLLWLLTEKDESLLPDLKDKIKSKYDVAKFFLGAFVVNTGLILNTGIWGQPQRWEAAPVAELVAYAGIVVALVSLILTAATLFSYDSLMMPESLWSEPRGKSKWHNRDRRPPGWSVSRPPSQAQVILFYEMMHVWSTFFIPAVLSAIVAIGCIVLALICRVEDCLPFPVPLPAIPSWGFFVLVAVIVLLSWLFYQAKKPRLGAED